MQQHVLEFKELISLLTLPISTKLALKDLKAFDDIERNFDLKTQKINYIFKVDKRRVLNIEINLSDLETERYRVFDYAVKKFKGRVSHGRKKNS